MLVGTTTFSHMYRAYYIGTSYTRLICFVLLGQGMIIYNGAKLGDATVARAPPLLCHPRNL